MCFSFSNTSYYTYDSGNANYYALNSKDQVFKCLDNKGGANSTDEPQLFLSSTSLEEPYFQTTDGYKWKYMYTLNTSQKERFLTSDWMPVTYNKFVRAAALNRSIDIVKVTNSGNNGILIFLQYLSFTFINQYKSSTHCCYVQGCVIAVQY